MEEKRLLVKEMLDNFMTDKDVRGYLSYADGECCTQCQLWK